MRIKKLVFTALTLIAVVSCSENNSHTPSLSFEPLPACKIEGLDNCLEMRGQRVVEFSKSIDSVTPLQDAFEIACYAGDAEACLTYSGLLEGDNSFMSSLKLLRPETLVVDQEKSLEAAQKSCRLNSIFGCVSVAVKLNALSEEGENISAEVALEAYSAIKKSCSLGYNESCELVAYYAYPVDAEAWPSGARDFYMEVRDHAKTQCELGDDYNCYEEAVFALQAGQREGGSREEIDAGLETLKQLCDGGDTDSCDVYKVWTEASP